MVEPDKRDINKAADLEDTVRNLREENAKLLQLLRSQGLLVDPSSDSICSTSNPPTDTTNLTFDHSSVTLTTNSINTTNQISHQHINNHGSTNQQNYNEQIIHGNQSNITPNFNTLIQSTTQPFVQNNSNTLVQNNTNLIQPINLVNFNNVSLDSIQSFFASQNSVVYLSQASATATTTTTTTTTSSSSSNFNLHESLPSNTHSILPPPSQPTSTSSSSSSPSLSEHQISIRPKPSLLHQHQELVPVIPKMKAEHYQSLTKQLSASATNDTTNLLDNDSNDSKQKYPRPIRPRPSARGHSSQNLKSVSVNQTRARSFANNSSSTVSLFSSPALTSQSSIEIDQPPQLLHSKSLDLSVSSTTGNKNSTQNRPRNRKKPSTSSVIPPSTNPTLVPIAPSLGRPLAPAPLNVQRSVTSNNPITKRANKKPTKRGSKTLVQSHSESILPQNLSPPSNSFAESISGLLENFDQELIASNFLPQATVVDTPPTTTTTSNLLSNGNNSIISSHTNIMETIDHDGVRGQELYHSTSASMPTLDEFHHRLASETILNPQIVHDNNAENEQISSIMNEEDLRLVEMTFDENTFLNQFDLEDPGIRLGVHSDQNLFANILTTNHDLIPIQQQSLQINEQPILTQNSLPQPPPLIYPGSSLINNNVFTTIVPLGLQQQTSQTNPFITNSNKATRLLPEEGVQLTARHIEPSQVATYESVKYQDILDDLVMITDQDALRHAQAAAAGDPSVVVTTDFSFALLEATNEMIKNTNIEIIDGNSSTFPELQYSDPIEQDQELLEKQLELDQDKQQQPIVILERLQSQIITSADLTKNVLDDSVINTSITDLSSILQFQSIESPIPHETSTTDLITPIRPTKPKSSIRNSIDYDPALMYSPISDTLGLSSNSLDQQSRSTGRSPKPCILFEPISSSSNPPSPIKSSQDEMIIDSGRLDDLHPEKSDFIKTDEEIEDLLRETITDKPYEIIENQGQTLMQNHVVIDNVEQLIDQIEPSEIDPKRTEIFEQTFSRYQEKYQLNLQRQHELSSKQPHEQSLIIPPVKLKLNSIYSKEKSEKKKRRSTSSTSKHQTEDEQPTSTPPPPPVERPSLKITIRTKLPAPIPSPEDKTRNKHIHKHKKSKSHHHHHHHHHHQKKNKTIEEKLETEYAGLTRFERPLAQLYHQQSPRAPIETHPKEDTQTPPPAPSHSQTESHSTAVHSGFLIDEQTPPSSITSNEHKQSPPPLLINQTKTEKFKMTYSHLLNYDSNPEHQNNDTYITPPPEIDLNLQQKSTSYDNYCSLSDSPSKRKRHHRKSSIASSSSSKSLTNTDYGVDNQALEPVSPTPISTSKQRHSHHPSTSSSGYDDNSPSFYEHQQQQKQMRDYYSRKSTSVSSSSSNRSSRTTTTSSSSSQMYPQSRSLSNHSYRTSQETPPLLPPILPPPPPPIHLDPYAQSYHHAFAPRAGPPPPFFNFSFPHPFLNAHPTAVPSHYPHHHPTKYHHPSYGYPTPQQPYSYHPHLQRQHQYNNSNYMSSRDHHSFDR